MDNVYIFPYKPGSKSAALLAEEIDVPRIRHRNSQFRGSADKTVINWGSGELPREVRRCRILNSADAVLRAVNKLDTFRTLQRAGVRTVPWTVQPRDTLLWMRDGHRVVARTSVEGRDGAGVNIMSRVSTIAGVIRAPLYTKFIPALNEYRVNICLDRTMGVQVKLPRRDATRVNRDIKTTDGGYGLVLTDHFPNGLRPLAREAISALGLDFGGVDIIHGTDGRFYVLEVNTAPELTPAMVRAYARRFTQELG